MHPEARFHPEPMKTQAILTLAALTASAAGTEVTLDAANRGYINEWGGYSYIGYGSANYWTSPSQSVRSYFVYDLSGLDGFTVTGARIELYNNYRGSSGSATLVMKDITTGTLNLSGAPTMTYDDLADGTVYGSVSTSAPGNLSTFITVELNADFLAALNPVIGAGSIGLGGSLIDTTSGAQVFAFSNGPMSDTRLVLTGTYASGPIPEPSTYGLALGGLALVGALIRRRRKN